MNDPKILGLFTEITENIDNENDIDIARLVCLFSLVSLLAATNHWAVTCLA